MILNTSDERHPADEIGKALSRAGGILSSLSNCFDKANAQLEVSLPFVFEAVTATEKLLTQANDELVRLYEHYDLSKIDQPTVLPDLIPIQETEAKSEHHSSNHYGASEEVSVQDFAVSSLATDAEPTGGDKSFLGSFRPTDQVQRLSNRLETILETIPAKQRRPAPLELADRPAESYNELFEKLTAMADAAAFQAHQTPGQSEELLPLLERLRADMLRIRSVA
ncbi:MAG: hypothetical protein KGO94_11355 [Alphaproteobacteria bacterium]|nr:hypothetical protein [Alphaproteobacteria bacterium]